MIGASKILTVSYGTFSCTLEGFDEPFNTMKAIAEYFRDLAADDRYFGAEPPTPDAAMLHKIAEREIQRRVEAKVQDNGVILRADSLPASEPVQLQAPLQDFHFAPPQPLTQPSEPVVMPSVAAEPISRDGGFESPAARLARLRAAAAAEAAAAKLVADAWPDAYIEDQHADAASDAMDAEFAKIELAETIEPEAVDAPVAGITEAVAVEPDVESETVIDVTVEEIDVSDQPKIDVSDQVDVDFIAKLAQDSLAAAEADSVAEAVAQPAPELFTETDDEAPDAAAFTAQDFAAPLDEDTLNAPTFESAGDDARLAAMNFDAEDALPEDAAPQLIDDVDQIDADHLSEQAAEAEYLPEAAEFDATDLAPPGVEIATETFDAPAADLVVATPEEIAPTVAPEKLQRARARVIKVRRLPTQSPAEPEATSETAPVEIGPASAAPAEVLLATAQPVRVGPVRVRSARAEARADANVGGSEPAEIPAIEQPAIAEPVLVDTSFEDDLAAATGSAAELPVILSDEAEADLQRELAAVEAETLPADVASEAPEATDEAVPSEIVTAVTSQPARIADPAEDPVDRLMAKAETELEMPENKRRLSAIAHLKAAVAATIADRRANPRRDANAQAEKLNPYQQDLNKVVLPREDTAASVGRLAPLVLVSSQRIDRPKQPDDAASASGQVRPRRVASAGGTTSTVLHVVANAEEDEDEDAGDGETLANIFIEPGTQSFEEFAERLGVSAMPDLLEAAGAYCALVLGRDQFTRPLLLETIGRLPGAEDHSREDGLRGFGTLLRDGRITKVRRGQFKLADGSHVLIEAKRITA